MKKSIYSLLALLVMGSASLKAQTDPFPEVTIGDYSGNMIYTLSVEINGTPLTEGVVAFYKGDEIRGKERIGNVEGYPDIALAFVYGDSQPEQLHAKVYSNGRIIEVAPANLKYIFNGIVGSFATPYVIDLPAPVVTTPTKEGWATTCLPFNAEVPEGVTVWNATGIANGELLMTKATGTILLANTPVLLQSTGLASYEWLARVADGDIATTGCIFTGATEPTAVAANSVLTLGYSNEGNHEIGFWRFTGTTIPANRAYITDFPAGSRGVTFRMDDETGISTVNRAAIANDRCYDLQGRRMANPQSSARQKDANYQQGARILNYRLYITNGRKVIIK